MTLQRNTLITDLDELAALPPRCVVRAADGTIAARFNDELGVLFGDDRPFQWSVLRVPALLLWVDGDSVAAPAQPATDPPASETAHPDTCLGVRVIGQMSSILCDEDGWVRSGMWHFDQDYKCTGSVHPPLDSPIWPGREIRCANPIHHVTLPMTSGVTISPTPLAGA